MAFDFDGTLAPIVPRPADAHLDPALAAPLQRLGAACGWIAVVSGRPRAFLEEQLPHVLALGSYGLELPPQLSAVGLPDGFPADAVRGRLARARDRVERDLPAGARLELKPWGLAMHFRDAGPAFDDHAAWELATTAAAENDLVVQRGRLVFELKPREAPDKGWAVRLLAQRLRPSAVVFAGDDLGDQPAWAAVHALDVPGLAVGVASPETPPEAMRSCDLVLEAREELEGFVDALAEGGAEAI